MQRPTLGDVVLMIVVLNAAIHFSRLMGVPDAIIVFAGFALWLMHGYWRGE